MATTTTAAARDRRGPATVPLDGDRRLAYAEYGTPDGTPVVFLHGTPGSRRLGELLDAAARDHGVRLLAPDRPGYGRSTPWPDYAVRDGGAVVERVLDHAGVETAGVVAFSGGAPFALAAAATRPERVTRVDCVAGATPPDAGDRTPPVQRLLAGLATTAPRALGGLLRGQAWLAARLDPSFVVAQYADDPDAVPEDAASLVKRDFTEAFAGGTDGAVAELRATATDWEVDFGAVDAEVHLRHGSADTNVPLDGVRDLASRLPARLSVLDGADHLGTLRRAGPAALAAHA